MSIFKQPACCSVYTNIVFIITQGFRELVVQRLKLIQNLKTVFGSVVYPEKKNWQAFSKYKCLFIYRIYMYDDSTDYVSYKIQKWDKM